MLETDDLEKVLREISAKLSGILATGLDPQREDGTRRSGRSTDQVLKDVGLSTKQIAAILGKTDRAVQLAVQQGKRRGESTR